MKRFYGHPGAPGITRGPVLVYDPSMQASAPRRVDSEDLAAELERFEAALKAAEKDILDARGRLAEELGEDHARIFEAHRYILFDPALLERARHFIGEGWSAETAYAEACEAVFRSLAQLGSELGDRSSDLRDVERRVLSHLQGRRVSGFSELREKVIIVARDISPSDTATMNRDKVLGFIIERGGETSHSVILGRSLGIPVVVGAENLLGQVQSGDTAILDGHTGTLIVHPDARALKSFEDLSRAYADLERDSLRFKDHPAETRDRRKIELLANIELPGEVSAALENGAAGIGLYRTEYIYITADSLPGEEEQYEAYRSVLEGMNPDPVIIRTMDLGGDKIAPYMDFPSEDNPSLGWRGVRYALDQVEIFKTQLRAILRAGAHGNLRLMVPMISRVEEIRQVKSLLGEVQAELDNISCPYSSDYQLGIMIETPSAVVIAHMLGREVDFFSIGTNDLIQYSLAIDRDNRYVQHLYDPFSPAILRQIKRTVKAGRDSGCWVGICGELPEDPLFVLLLIGLGLDEISASAYRIPELKRVIRSITFDQAKNLVKSAWSYSTGSEIRRNVRRLAIRKFPELKELLMRHEHKVVEARGDAR